MASPLDRFKKHSVGSSDRYVDFISYIEPSGELKKLTNVDAVMNSWYNILRTPIRSHVSDPEFGTSIFQAIFEPATQDTIDVIKNEIIEKLNKYDDRATISQINIYFFKDMKGFEVNIIARYKGEQSELKINYTENLYRNFFD